MCGPVSSNAYSHKWVVKECCCGCTLRTGSLIIAWIHIISCSLYTAHLIYHIMKLTKEGKEVDSMEYVKVIDIIIPLLIGLLVIIGTYKQNAKAFWVAVYIRIALTLVFAVFCFIFFVAQVWYQAILHMSGFLVSSYFIIVLRSYGYEIEANNRQFQEMNDNVNKEIKTSCHAKEMP